MKDCRSIAHASLARAVAFMKNHLAPFVLLILALAFIGSISTGSAQIYAKDDASSYTNPPGNIAWMSLGTSNAGFGFTPWVFSRGGSGFQGYYIGNGGEGSLMSTNNKFWGMYANGGGNNNVAVAYRGF